MDIILLSDLKHVGRRGEEVAVKPGYARNYLLPQGLAIKSTPGNRKWFEQQRSKIDARHARERDQALEVAGVLTNLRLSIEKRVGATQTLYGSVTATEVADLLAEKGVTIDRRKIDLVGGIKTVGDHVVHIDLHPEVTAEVTVTVVGVE